MKQKPKTVSPQSNDGRNAYVVEHLTDALVSLLAEKELHKISIRELCSRAEVGRVSFYRNYESKEAVLNAHIHGLFQEWTMGWQEHQDAPLSEHIRTLFAHLEKHREFYGVLYERGLLYLLKDVILETIGPAPDCTGTEAYAAAFVTYTIYGWVEVWFQRGVRESSAEMAALFRAQGL